jgi:hypothetical protein
MNFTEALKDLDCYPQENATAALKAMGYTENSDNISEEDVVSAFESLEALGFAVKQTKELAGTAPVTPTQTPSDCSEQTEALVLQDTTELVKSAKSVLTAQNIGFSDRVLFAIATSIANREQQRANLLAEVQEKTFVAAWQQRQKDYSNRILDAMAEQEEVLDNLLSSTNIQKIVDKKVTKVEEVNVDEFLEEMKERENQRTTRRQQVTVERQASVDSKVEFDTDSFLDEVWG